MTPDSVRVRFAPSPTGYLHVGGARTALYNWLFARHYGGSFILRIEDTDQRRYSPEALPDLLRGLRWLGLCWDEGPEVGGSHGPYYQSDRIELYRKYAQQLVNEGLAYRCYCTAERLAEARDQQRAAGQPEGYDQHCRTLTSAQIAENEAQGLPYTIRFRMPSEGTTEFDDALRGHISVESKQLNDLVLLKSDGYPTYHLANVVDDHLMEITHIMRGEEWISTVPVHVQLYRAFGWDMPVQAHLPTILDPSGKGKLSKRKKKLANGQEALTYVHEFREAGYLPEALVNFLALVGWSFDGQTEFFRRDELVRHFDLDRVNKSPAAFSYDKLNHMNASYIRELGANDLAGRLLQVLLKDGFPAEFAQVRQFVPLVQERLKTLTEVPEWVDFFYADALTYPVEELVQKKMDRESTLATLAGLRSGLADLEDFRTAAIETRLRELAEASGLKARDFFGCLRVAISGKRVAPPLFESLEILGKPEALNRLDDAWQRLSQS